MAAIGKIRSWGPVLATVIGLALFAFIAEEMFRSCEATSNEKRQQVGEVLGKKISVQEFQEMVDEYQSFPKLNEVVKIGRFEFKIIKNTMTKIELVRLKVTE